MPNMRNTFHLGAINTDANSRFVKNGETTNSENTMYNGLGNDGVASSFKSAAEIDLSSVVPDNAQHYSLVGHTKDNYTMYLFYNGGDTEDFIIEYTIKGKHNTFQLVAHSNKLKLREADGNYLSANVVDGRFLYYTLGKYIPYTGEVDPTSSPKRFNIADAKANPVTYFDEIDINNILPRPLAPTIIKVSGSDLKVSGNFTVVCRAQTKDKEWTPLGYKSNTLVMFNESSTIQVDYSLDLKTMSNAQLYRIEFYLIQDNTSVAKLVKGYDVEAGISDYTFTFQGEDYQMLLDVVSASTVNYETPIKSGEQELLSSRIVYSNSELTLPQFADTTKYIPFDIAYRSMTEITYEEEVIVAAESDILFPDPDSELLIEGTHFDYTLVLGDDFPSFVGFEGNFEGGTNYVANMQAMFDNSWEIELTVSREGTDTKITGFATGIFGWQLHILESKSTKGDELKGINPYNSYYICNIFYDEYGRNIGASNETELGNIYNPTEGNVINFKTTQTGVITPPTWAKYYSVGITKPSTNYEYYQLIAPHTVEGVVLYSITNLGLSTSFLKSLEHDQTKTLDVSLYNSYRGGSRSSSSSNTTSTAPRDGSRGGSYSSDDRYDYGSSTSSRTSRTDPTSSTEIVYPESKKILLRRLDVADGDVEVTVIAKDSEALVGLNLEHTYVESDIPLVAEGVYVYEVPSLAADTDSLFYESQVWELDGNTFKGDGEWVNVQDISFEKELPTSYVDVKLFKKIIKTYRPFVRQALTGITGRATAVHSQNYEASSNYNGLGIFSSVYNNYWDFDIRYGQIKKTINRSGSLIVIQNDKWSIMSISERIIQDGGNGLIEKTNNFFNKPQYYMGDFGVGDPASVCYYNDKIYGVDEKNRVLLRLGENGLNVLNGNMSQEIIEAFEDYNNRVFSGYDPNINGVIFSLMDMGKIGATGEAFVYSEKLNSVTTKLKGIFKHMINVGTSLFCHRDIALNTEDHSILMEVYGSNEYTGSYAKEEDDTQFFSFVFNDHPSITKTFQSITIEGTHAVKIFLKTNLGQNAVIQAEDFKLQEGIWYADVPRENNTISGDEMKGVSMSVSALGMFDEIYAVGCRFTTSSNLPERN